MHMQRSQKLMTLEIFAMTQNACFETRKESKTIVDV